MHLNAMRTIFALGLGLSLAVTACKDPAAEEAAPKKSARHDSDANANSSTTTGNSSTTGDTHSTTGDTTSTSTTGETSTGTSGATQNGTSSSGGTGGTTTDCTNHNNNTTTTGNGTSTTGGGLLRTDEHNIAYNLDIKTILDNKCMNCHVPGKNPPELDTFQKVKSSAIDTIRVVEKDRMPPHDNLTTAEIRKIRAWVDAGAPEYAGSSNSNNNTTGANPCDQSTTTGSTTTGTTTGTDSAEGWQDLINPPLLKECHNKGVVYDRTGEKCHKAKIATSYLCTHQGIVDKFKALSVDITTNIAQIEADGYQIDQCGEFNNEPIVLFYKKQEAENELKLLFKKFCKKGSDACNN